MLTLNKVFSSRGKFIVASLHALLGERPGILDLLLSDPTPARLFGRVVLFRCPAMENTPRAKLFTECGIFRIVGQLRFLLAIQVIEVSEELIESMCGWQVFV